MSATATCDHHATACDLPCCNDSHIDEDSDSRSSSHCSDSEGTYHDSDSDDEDTGDGKGSSDTEDTSPVKANKDAPCGANVAKSQSSKRKRVEHEDAEDDHNDSLRALHIEEIEELVRKLPMKMVRTMVVQAERVCKREAVKAEEVSKWTLRKCRKRVMDLVNKYDDAFWEILPYLPEEPHDFEYALVRATQSLRMVDHIAPNVAREWLKEILGKTQSFVGMMRFMATARHPSKTRKNAFEALLIIGVEASRCDWGIKKEVHDAVIQPQLRHEVERLFALMPLADYEEYMQGGLYDELLAGWYGWPVHRRLMALKEEYYCSIPYKKAISRSH